MSLEEVLIKWCDNNLKPRVINGKKYRNFSEKPIPHGGKLIYDFSGLIKSIFDDRWYI